MATHLDGARAATDQTSPTIADGSTPVTRRATTEPHGGDMAAVVGDRIAGVYA